MAVGVLHLTIDILHMLLRNEGKDRWRLRRSRSFFAAKPIYPLAAGGSWVPHCQWLQHSGRRLSVAFIPFGFLAGGPATRAKPKLYGCSIMGTSKRGKWGMERVDMRHGDRTINCTFGKAKGWIVLVFCLSGGVCSFLFQSTVMIMGSRIGLSYAAIHLELSLPQCPRSRISHQQVPMSWRE